MTERPLCVLVGALGGQGGGVLADWLTEAARLAGYPAQSTSIPGVAQRTGATTYYFELFPVRTPSADPIFCLFPSAGDVDLMVALEPTEAGRAFQAGYITAQTTVISQAGRIYSTAEKSVAGDGTLDARTVLEAIGRAAKALIRVEASSEGNSQANAVMFGAVIGSGVLPLTEAEGRRAIEARGLAVKLNLAGFESGLALVRAPAKIPSSLPDPAGLYHSLPRACRRAPPAGFEEQLASLPSALRPLAGHALARLVDYQDEAYAGRYLERLAPIVAADDAAASRDHRLSCEVARRLGAWMSYEDVIRVAQLKTRPGRLARIRAEVGAQPGEPVVVEDYLSPSREQVTDVLPAGLARLVPEFGLPLRWRTSSPWGFAALKFLAALKPLRPHTTGFAREHQAIELWLKAITDTARRDYALACQVAELAAWARGYGDVRARGFACLNNLLSNWAARLDNLESARADVGAALHALRHDPDAACVAKR